VSFYFVILNQIGKLMKNFGVYTSGRDESILKNDPDQFIGDFLNMETLDVGLEVIWYVAKDGVPTYVIKKDAYLKEIPDYGPC